MLGKRCGPVPRWPRHAKRLARASPIAVGFFVVVATACGEPQGAEVQRATVSSSLEWSQQQKIVGPSGAASFGRSIQLASDDLIVGSAHVGTIAGDARVYVRVGPAWQLQQLLAPAGKAADQVGASVAISGDDAIVGAPGHTTLFGGASIASGRAVVYSRSGGTWAQVLSLPGTSTSAFELAFGQSVALSGDHAVIGAPKSASGFGGISCGAAYVYERSGGGWVERAVLWGHTNTTGGFGQSVAISGDSLMVGDTKGASFVFVRSGNQWTLQQELVGGAPVALSADRAVAGGTRVYTRSAGVWTQEATLVPSDTTLANFGASVSISGDVIVVGAPGYGGDSGGAFVFERTGSSWVETGKLLPLDADIDDYYGTAVSVSGSAIAVGAIGDDEGGTGAGAAYLVRGLESQGSACASAAECATGHCVDGVCCDTACGSGVDDCQSCVGGTCTLSPSGAVCRAPAHDCDAPEICDGAKPECPADLGEPDGAGCDDGDACTGGDACKAGVCSAGPNVCSGGTSAGGGSGTGAAGSGGSGATGSSAADDGGCGCRAAPAGQGGLAWLVVWIGLGLAHRARRRAGRTLFLSQ